MTLLESLRYNTAGQNVSLESVSHPVFVNGQTFSYVRYSHVMVAREISHNTTKVSLTNLISFGKLIKHEVWESLEGLFVANREGQLWRNRSIASISLNAYAAGG